MGRLIRIIVVLGVAWAVWHVGLAAWHQFQFSTDVEEVAKFGPDRDEAEVRAVVLDAAAKYGLPVADKDVKIRKEGSPAGVYIDISYTVQIEILPRVIYPWTFTTSAHGWFVPGGRAQPK
jgi:hypothetical protein